MGPGQLRLGAALFNGDHGRLADEVARIEEAGLDFVHLDVFDGHLVPDLGFPPRTIATLRPLTRLPFEVHLAAADPLRFVPQLAEAGCDLLLFHAENVPMLYETIFTVREHNIRVGLVLGLGAPLQLLSRLSRSSTPCCCWRGSPARVQGATFNPLVLSRVEAVAAMARAANADLDVQVAGGVNRNHVAALSRVGATSLALGAGLYKASDMAREVAELRALAHAGVA